MSERESDPVDQNTINREGDLPEAVIEIKPPWVLGGSQRIRIRGAPGMGMQFARASETFLKERSRVHNLYIREQEMSRRLGLVIGTVLLLGAMMILAFAPSGRETLSYWIGAAMVLLAAGAAGSRRVWGSAPMIKFGADNGNSTPPDDADK